MVINIANIRRPLYYFYVTEKIFIKYTFLYNQDQLERSIIKIGLQSCAPTLQTIMLPNIYISSIFSVSRVSTCWFVVLFEEILQNGTKR